MSKTETAPKRHTLAVRLRQQHMFHSGSTDSSENKATIFFIPKNVRERERERADESNRHKEGFSVGVMQPTPKGVNSLGKVPGSASIIQYVS